MHGLFLFTLFFSFPVEMMVVSPDGEVLIHSNANSLLNLSEEEATLTPFEYVETISVL